MRIALICPSRGRPDSARAMRASAASSAAGRVDVYFVVDEDDPTLTEYPEVGRIVVPPTGNMAGATTLGLRMILDACPETCYDVYAFVGDDVRFRSFGWDEAISNALSTPGIAYGDDGLHHGNLATHWFVSAALAETLGLMIAPVNHFYSDNAWTDLGRELGILRYVPEAKIEHLHYSLGKSEFDETYARSDQWWRSGEDAQRYHAWRNSDQWAALLEKTRGLL